MLKAGVLVTFEEVSSLIWKGDLTRELLFGMFLYPTEIWLHVTGLNALWPRK